MGLSRFLKNRKRSSKRGRYEDSWSVSKPKNILRLTIRFTHRGEYPPFESRNGVGFLWSRKKEQTPRARRKQRTGMSKETRQRFLSLNSSFECDERGRSVLEKASTVTVREASFSLQDNLVFLYPFLSFFLFFANLNNVRRSQSSIEVKRSSTEIDPLFFSWKDSRAFHRLNRTTEREKVFEYT